MLPTTHFEVPRFQLTLTSPLKTVFIHNTDSKDPPCPVSKQVVRLHSLGAPFLRAAPVSQCIPDTAPNFTCATFSILYAGLTEDSYETVEATRLFERCQGSTRGSKNSGRSYSQMKLQLLSIQIAASRISHG